jgi:hypothetical protein
MEIIDFFFIFSHHLNYKKYSFKKLRKNSRLKSNHLNLSNLKLGITIIEK